MLSSDAPQMGATSGHGPTHEPERDEPTAPARLEHNCCACQTLIAVLDGPSGTNTMTPPLAALDGLKGTNKAVPPSSTSSSPTAMRNTPRPPARR